MKEEISMV